MSLWLGMMAGSLLAGGNFEPISTITVGSGGASSITFSSIPGTYQHLQVRALLRTARAQVDDLVAVRANSDSGSNYVWHRLLGDGSGVAASGSTSQTYAGVGYMAAANDASSMFGALVLDVLDYSSTSKNSTFRSAYGEDSNGSGSVGILSGLWLSTSAITGLRLLSTTSSNFAQYSTAALYGIRS